MVDYRRVFPRFLYRKFKILFSLLLPPIRSPGVQALVRKILQISQSKEQNELYTKKKTQRSYHHYEAMKDSPKIEVGEFE